MGVSHQFGLTVSELVAELKAIGIERAVFGEHAYRSYCIVIAVPRKHEDKIRNWMKTRKPGHVSVSVRWLPWWKCWFVRYQNSDRGFV